MIGEETLIAVTDDACERGRSFEVNLTEGAEKMEEDALEHLINDLSFQNLRNNSLTTQKRIFTEWREYKGGPR